MGVCKPFIPQSIVHIRTVMDNMEEASRDGFTSKRGFILSCIGSAVGMGNIWRFPIMVCIWGGLTFLIPYFIFVVLIASTGVISEFALGRSAGSGPIGAFGRCTQVGLGRRRLGERIGIIPVVGSLALAIGYTCVMAWVLKYTYMAFTGDLSAMGEDMAAIGGMFDSTASAWGANSWVLITVLVTLLIMSLGVAGGIERANKVMLPILYALFIGLGIYIFTLPGSELGYEYILTLDPTGLLNPLVWIFAFGQAFFSLSVAGNGSVIYGSYLSRKESIPNCARYVALFDTIGAMMAAMVIIPAMAAAGGQLDTAGPGLMFIYLVQVFNGMAGGQVIGVVFFVCVTFAGLTSLINLYEAPVAYIQERFRKSRASSSLVILAIGCAVALCIQAVVSDWMDAVSIYVCPLGALLAAVMFFWIAGRDYVLESVNEGSRKPIGRWFFPAGKYVYCTLAIVALVAGALFGGIG